jgi:3-phosphoshikimate 1-carboxyvinyltransferase
MIRMAMAFAPLALKVPIIIADANVVSKSYPDFWEDMKTLGYKVSEIPIINYVYRRTAAL